jgi:hypothetical protein
MRFMFTRADALRLEGCLSAFYFVLDHFDRLDDNISGDEPKFS